MHSPNELEKSASLERKHLFPFRQSPRRYNSSHCTTLENTDSPTSITFKRSWYRAVCPRLLPSHLTSQQTSPAASFPHPGSPCTAKHPKPQSQPGFPIGAVPLALCVFRRRSAKMFV